MEFINLYFYCPEKHLVRKFFKVAIFFFIFTLNFSVHAQIYFQDLNLTLPEYDQLNLEADDRQLIKDFSSDMISVLKKTPVYQSGELLGQVTDLEALYQLFVSSSGITYCGVDGTQLMNRPAEVTSIDLWITSDNYTFDLDQIKSLDFKDQEQRVLIYKGTYLDRPVLVKITIFSDGQDSHQNKEERIIVEVFNKKKTSGNQDLPHLGGKEIKPHSLTMENRRVTQVAPFGVSVVTQKGATKIIKEVFDSESRKIEAAYEKKPVTLDTPSGPIKNLKSFSEFSDPVEKVKNVGKKKAKEGEESVSLSAPLEGGTFDYDGETTAVLNPVSMINPVDDVVGAGITLGDSVIYHNPWEESQTVRIDKGQWDLAVHQTQDQLNLKSSLGGEHYKIIYNHKTIPEGQNQKLQTEVMMGPIRLGGEHAWSVTDDDSFEQSSVGLGLGKNKEDLTHNKQGPDAGVGLQLIAQTQTGSIEPNNQTAFKMVVYGGNNQGQLMQGGVSIEENKKGVDAAVLLPQMKAYVGHQVKYGTGVTPSKSRPVKTIVLGVGNNNKKNPKMASVGYENGGVKVSLNNTKKSGRSTLEWGISANSGPLWSRDDGEKQKSQRRDNQNDAGISFTIQLWH